MNLSQAMKTLMAYCYSRDNAHHYEYVLDKRDGLQAVRLFLTETNYLYLQVIEDGNVRVYHYEVVKSSSHPSERMGFINKYFKKYRDGYKCIVPLKDLINILEKIDAISVFEALKPVESRDSYNPWRGVTRATGRY